MHAHQHVGGAHGAHVGGEAVPPELVRLAARARPARAQFEQLRKVGDAPPASAVLVERLRAVDEEDAQRRGRCGRRRGRRGRRGRVGARHVRRDPLRGTPRCEGGRHMLVRVEQRLEAAHEDALVAARLAALLLEAVARLAAQLELRVALETARPDLAQRGERVLAEGAEERLVP